MKKLECEQTRLILALHQVDNLTNLLEDNEYKTFMYSHLMSVKCELERQLRNLTNTSLYPKIEE
jgi:predicted RNA-binding protein with EMAP domain